ncbi:Nnf1-domain-containing protein [Acephala macrosclerotiorum]|nr:Nnf1-domain-containing protein [Acephala macrosclerotiorum]
MPSADPSTSTNDNRDESPSPPPQAPVQAAPGPRAAALLDLYDRILTNTLKSISYPSFSSCFPQISIQASHALQGMHSGMISRLGDFAREEFQTILEERGVVERLNRLEDLIADARRRKARSIEGDGEGEILVPPHTLPPKPLMNAHTLPLHIAQNSQLNARLQTQQSMNANLMVDIRAQREEIERLLKLVEQGGKDLGDAGERLGEKVGELSGEGREAGEVLMKMEG